MGSGPYRAICDQCGRKRHASELRLTWDNFFVCADTCWQPRHPQDFVQGRADDQTVPIVRPDVPQTMGETTIFAVGPGGTKNATTVTLTSTVGIGDRDTLGIVLDTGECHWTFSDGAPVGNIVRLGSYLPGETSTGNTVYVPGINNETFITATGLTATGL